MIEMSVSVEAVKPPQCENSCVEAADKRSGAGAKPQAGDDTPRPGVTSLSQTSFNPVSCLVLIFSTRGGWGVVVVEQQD